MSAPKLNWLVKHLSRPLRLGLLEALAWPEFKVTRSWLVPDPSAPSGVRVDQLPLDEAAAKEAELAFYIQIGGPVFSQEQLASRRSYAPVNMATSSGNTIKNCTFHQVSGARGADCVDYQPPA